MSEVLSKISVLPNDPSFFEQAFTVISKKRKAILMKDGDNLKRVCSEEYDELSKRLDNTQVQDSCAVRNVLRTRRLANLLVDDKGELILSLFPGVITHLTNYKYSLGPQRQHDVKRNEQIIKVLTALCENKELVRMLRQISKPFSHPQADQIIRDTLQLSPATAITDAHARRAALAAWMCYLRQNVGSCFATAPAIIVHDEQPELFLTDLLGLLSTGRIKRTYGGEEHSAPLSASWGAGDLRRPILMSHWDPREECKVWYGPGLLNALEAAGILTKELSLEQKTALTKDLVLQAYPEWGEKHPMMLTNAEEILRRILMKHNDISDADLQAYDSRPKGMIFSGLLMQTPSSSAGMGGKGGVCATYYYQFDNAATAFKALADNALLKSWEYTIAAFAETKTQFTRWNLYSSLGFRPEEPGGIGQALFEIIKRKLDECNQKVRDYQFEYEHLFPQLKQLEVRIKHAASESEAQWIRVEYQSKAQEFHMLEEVRDKTHVTAEKLANMFDFLINQYDQLFPEYFQEVYDPDLHEVQVGPYDDSPAGFRLLYKHGRANTSQWTKIKTPQEFVDTLAHFFSSTESAVAAALEFDDLQRDITDITTTVVNHIRTQEFLETAFHRMATAHRMKPIQNPLDNLDKIPMKPWAYVSGGTMGSLVSSYFRLEHKPTEVARWVENPIELLVFLVDTLKQIPYRMMDGYLKDPNKSLIMHSPTHAFLLKPGYSQIKEAWQTEAYTYTWIRDFLIRPMEQAVAEINLDEESLNFLIEKFTEVVPVEYQHYFRKVFAQMHGRMSPQDFRFYVLDKIEHERGLQYAGRGVLSVDDFDRMVYSLLPLFPANQLAARLDAIWARITQMPPEIRSELAQLAEECVDRMSGRQILSAQNLQEIATALICLAYEQTSLSFDCQLEVTRAAQQLGYAMPNPIIFADTNWSRDWFAFLVSPTTNNLELWRVDPTGRLGVPMSSWREWLNGTRREPLWGAYTHPHEYTASLDTDFSGKIRMR